MLLTKLFRSILTFLLMTVFTMTYSHAQFYVTTYAGTIGGFADGDTSVAKFKKPFGMCIDLEGNLYVADPDNNRIRKISSDVIPIVTTIGGDGIAGYADGPAATSEFNGPSDVCVDVYGNVYVSDFANHRIREISIDGNVTTIAGNGIEGFADGDVTGAEFDYPRGIVLDTDGNLFIGDSWNHRIRKIDMLAHTVSTFAGGGNITGVGSIGDYIDAADTTARFYTPSGLAIDADNNIYVADAYNHRIRKITPDGMVTTIAGSGPTGAGLGGFADGDVASAILNTPTEVYANNDGEVFFSDTFNNRVRRLNGGNISTIAGDGTGGYIDGETGSSEFNYPRGIVSNDGGNTLFVCDYNNHVVRKLDAYTIGIEPETANDVFSVIQEISDGTNSINCIVNSSSNGIINVCDLAGRILQTITTDHSGIYPIILSQYTNGIYFCTYFELGIKQSVKFAVIK